MTVSLPASLRPLLAEAAAALPDWLLAATSVEDDTAAVTRVEWAVPCEAVAEAFLAKYPGIWASEFWSPFRKGAKEAVAAERKRRGIDVRVSAVRADRKVGRGSCSVVDEAMTDEELVAALDKARVRSISGALKWAHAQHARWARVTF